MANYRGRKGQGKRYRAALASEAKAVRSLDKLAQFELFDSNIMPQLKRMVLEGWPPEKIRKHFAPLIQALAVQRALGKGLDSFKAMKDLLDRHEGTAVQRVENKTLYARMDKKELAALALQKLKDANIIDTTGKVVRNVTRDDEET